MSDSVQLAGSVASSFLAVGSTMAASIGKGAVAVNTMVHNHPWIVLALLMAWKNIPLAVGSYTYATFKPTTSPAVPTFTGKDVTVIIPTTFKTPAELVACIRRIMLNQPAAVYVVTAETNHEVLNALLFDMEKFGPEVKTLFVTKLNKRAQILEALQHVKTDLLVLADDDVFWPDDFFKYMLAIFEDENVGAGGPRQRVKRVDNVSMAARIWNMLGIAYLERRVFNNCATNAIDGSISTLSGRTAVYRTKILQNQPFEYYFTHDTWRGRPLNSDDDKCLTRWVYKQNWDIRLQFDPRSTIETTVESDRKYLDQCLRWARAHWRGNFTVMENEAYWRSSKYLWGLFYIYLGQFRTPSLLFDILQVYLLSVCMERSGLTSVAGYGPLITWILFSKNLKMIPHYRRYPQDLWFVPISITFSWFHGFLNVYALCTMTKTHWGSQKLEELEVRQTDEELEPLLEEIHAEADEVEHELELEHEDEGDENHFMASMPEDTFEE